MPEPIPQFDPVPIIIASDVGAAMNATPMRPLAAIVPPSPDGWNDFDYNFSASLWVLTADDRAVQLNLRMLIEGAIRTDIFLPQLLAGRPWINLERLNSIFCTILTNVDSYRQIVEALGFGKAVTVLRHLGDAVVVQLEQVDEPEVALARQP